MAARKTSAEESLLQCIGGCNRTIKRNNANFYTSKKAEYDRIDGYCNVCKQCLRNLCFDKDGMVNLKGVKTALQHLDKPFKRGLFLQINSEGFDLGNYLKRLNFKYRDEVFADSDSEEVTEPIKPVENRTISTGSNKGEMSEEDIKVKEDVIRLMGYDPFDGHEGFDQKFLYNELSAYLDEDTLHDTFKLSQIIQLVNNNNQVRKIDLVIANLSKDELSLISKQGDIKNLTAIKNQIVASTDKIAKENSISVKNRGDKSAGKSTLTYLMKDCRELGFEDAEQDYYDENKARGMQLVAEISNKSILQQLQLDENDFNDILFTQRTLINELQTKCDDLEEENRQLYVQISELKKRLYNEDVI